MGPILCISGTSRPDNYTSRALGVVRDELAKREREVTYFDARELALSFPGQPPTPDAERLEAAVKSASGIVLATPEYHGSFCAMTKLIIENMGFPSALRDKPVALMGVAAGRIGAIKSLEQLRGVCAHTGAIVLPPAVSVAGVRNVFDEEGNCTDDGVEKALRDLASSLLEFLSQYVCPKHYLEEMVRAGDAPGWATSA